MDAATQRNILAYDLGGTTVRAGFFSGGRLTHGPIVRTDSDLVRCSSDPLRALQDVLAGLAAQAGAAQVDAVVLAVPGPVVDGRTRRLPTLFPDGGEEHIDFTSLARDLWPSRPVGVCNDLTAAGYRFVGDGFSDFMVLTVGSGVGAKLFVGGRPLLGTTGHGGEIGHWQVPGARSLRCDCGGFGHLGAVASGRGALRLAKAVAADEPGAFAASEAGRLSETEVAALTNDILVHALHLGDAWTVGVLGSVAAALGTALGLCHLTAGTPRFFVTGGFAGACGEPFRRMICEAAAAHVWPTGLDWNEAVVIADRREEHGVLGGAVYGGLLLSGMIACN